MTDLGEYSAARYEQGVVDIAQRLRNLATEVEQAGKVHANDRFDGLPRFAHSATKVLHTLAWGFANLNADSVVERAGIADRWTREANSEDR